jgi:formamidopyrimidine-DNA glycosylase
MPELIEIEMYRRAFDPLLGRTIDFFEVCHPSYVRPSDAPAEAFQMLVGGRLFDTHRHGKLLVLVVDCQSERIELGLRFGMTGRLLVDGVGPIDQLEYASSKNDPAWDRTRISFGAVTVTMRDQRRLGSIELDPDTSLLGPDAATVSEAEMVEAFRGRRASIKGVLLDQSAIAGLGNLLVDETLWRVGIAPQRGASSLDAPETTRLARIVRDTVAELSDRGGSHMGDTFAVRRSGAVCPRCGAEMAVDSVAGRTSWWCPEHQR